MGRRAMREARDRERVAAVRRLQTRRRGFTVISEAEIQAEIQRKKAGDTLFKEDGEAEEAPTDKDLAKLE